MECEFNILITVTDGWWTAQGVEYDFVAQAKTLDDLEYEFQRMVMVHIATCHELAIEPFSNMPPAPEEVRTMFRMARPITLEPTTRFSGATVTSRAGLPNVDRPVISARVYGGEQQNQFAGCQ